MALRRVRINAIAAQQSFLLLLFCCCCFVVVVCFFCFLILECWHMCLSDVLDVSSSGEARGASQDPLSDSHWSGEAGQREAGGSPSKGVA